MGELKADWRLRLRQGGADGPVCGAGVLLTQDRALTCAHVVKEPDARIWVEFAENPAIASVGARVAEGGWLPTVGARGEDIAVLALESPARTPPPPRSNGAWSAATRCGSAATRGPSPTGCG